MSSRSSRPHTCGRPWGCDYAKEGCVFTCSVDGRRHRCDAKCTLRYQSPSGSYVCPVSGRNYGQLLCTSTYDAEQNEEGGGGGGDDDGEGDDERDDDERDATFLEDGSPTTSETSSAKSPGRRRGGSKRLRVTYIDESEMATHVPTQSPNGGVAETPPNARTMTSSSLSRPSGPRVSKVSEANRGKIANVVHILLTQSSKRIAAGIVRSYVDELTRLYEYVSDRLNAEAHTVGTMYIMRDELKTGEHVACEPNLFLAGILIHPGELKTLNLQPGHITDAKKAWMRVLTTIPGKASAVAAARAAAMSRKSRQLFDVEEPTETRTDIKFKTHDQMVKAYMNVMSKSKPA